MFMPAPRAFRDPAQVAARLELLKTAPSVQPLLAWSTEFAARRTAATGIPTVVPHFDEYLTGWGPALLTFGATAR